MLESLTRRDLGSKSHQLPGAALTAAVAAPVLVPPRRAGAASLLWGGSSWTRSPLWLCRFWSLFPQHHCPDGWGKVQQPQQEGICFSRDIGKSAAEGKGSLSPVFCLEAVSRGPRGDDALRELSEEAKPSSAPCKSQPTPDTAEPRCKTTVILLPGPHRVPKPSSPCPGHCPNAVPRAPGMGRERREPVRTGESSFGFSCSRSLPAWFPAKRKEHWCCACCWRCRVGPGSEI